MSIHMILLTMSACAFAGAAASASMAHRSVQAWRSMQMSLSVAGALVIGNAACLLPGTPTWYATSLVVLTGAGLAWIVVSMAAAVQDVQRSQRPRTYAYAAPRADAPQGTRRLSVITATPVVTTAPAVEARPQLRLVPAPDASSQQTRDAGAEDARRVVTRAELDLVGSPAARAQSVAVARDLATYGPVTRGRERGTGLRPRLHPAPSVTVRRSQVAAAYDGHENTPRHDGHA